MRLFLVLLFFAGIAFTARAQYPTDDRPVIIRQVPTDSLDYDDFGRRQDENPLKNMSFRERILLGGGIGSLSFSSNYTAIGIAPQVGYQATMSTILGLYTTYTFQSYRYQNITGGTYRENFSLVSAGPFVRQQLSFLPEPINKVYAQAEVDQYWGLNFKTNYKPSVLIGGGLNLGGFNITLLYNTNYVNSYESPFSSPLVIRFAGFFTGPRF